MMKKVAAFICMIILGASVFAQEVSLVVSGEGVTKDAATASALRSAIEQTYGTFVSANTTLLNDDIVREEVATVASGNIKSYKELSCIRKADGVYEVSVSAVVSIGRLISYAKSHGSSAEFAGQTFAMEMKMRELNRKNEYEALQNLIVQLKFLQDYIFDGEITVNNPVSTHSGYSVPVELTVKGKTNYLYFYEVLFNTLSALSLSETDQTAYRNSNTPYSKICKSLHSDQYRVYYPAWDKINPDYRICLRNSDAVVEKFLADICDILNGAYHSLKVAEKGGGGKVKNIEDNEQLFEVKRAAPGYFCIGSKMHNYFEDTDPLPRTNDFLVGKYVINFDYTIEELSTVNGYEITQPETVLVLPDESNRIQFETTANKIGIIYTLEDGKAKIPLKKDKEIVIDFNNRQLIAPDFYCEFSKISEYMDTINIRVEQPGHKSDGKDISVGDLMLGEARIVTEVNNRIRYYYYR